MAENTQNILLVGVGGQGIILASEIISEVALRSGYESKKSEVHGMSQRGGVVSSHVRFGHKVYSPLIEEGKADILCAFEIVEALRWLNYLKKDGVVLANTQRIIPPIAASGLAEYPENPEKKLFELVPGAILLPAGTIAHELGNPRLTNTIMLGQLSTFLPELKEDVWLEVVAEFVPKRFRDLNIEAFKKGKKLKK